MAIFKRDDKKLEENKLEEPQKYKAICDKCGQECELSFKPSGDKPIYCNNCFKMIKEEKRSREKESGKDSKKHKFSAICSNCGKKCEIPFKPTPGKPIYCDNCFKQKKGGGKRDERKQSNKQFDVLNSKLDKIINLLSQANLQKEIQAAKKEKKEIKKTPIKKTTTKKETKKKKAKKKTTKKVAKKAAAKKTKKKK